MNKEQYEAICNQAKVLQLEARYECGSYMQGLVDSLVNMLEKAKPQD